MPTIFGFRTIERFTQKKTDVKYAPLWGEGGEGDSEPCEALLIKIEFQSEETPSSQPSPPGEKEYMVRVM